MIFHIWIYEESILYPFKRRRLLLHLMRYRVRDIGMISTKPVFCMFIKIWVKVIETFQSWFCATFKIVVFPGLFTLIEVTRGAYASISFIFLATFVSSTFLNCMLLAVIGKYDGLKNPLRMLLLNMASCDLIATILGVFMTTISKRDLKSQKLMSLNLI